MSKKKDIDLDDWDLDDDLDMDFDFDPPSAPVPTGRKAIMSLPKSAAVGATNAVVGEGKRRQLILKSLPEDYTVAAGAYDNLASEGASIYREAKEELRKTKRELKRAGREISPILRPYLPKSLVDRVDKWTKDDTSTGDYTDADPRQTAIDGLLSDTFASREEERKERLSERTEDEIKDTANVLRQNRLHETLAGVQSNTDNMVSYQNTVTTNYRKKMLEVNYRQYFALTDILEVTKASMEKLVPATESIVKNTGLPDYAKEEFLEVGQAMFRRKVLSALSPEEFSRTFISKLGTNIKSSISDFFGGARDTISMAGGMAGMMGGTDDEENLSPEQQRTRSMQTGASLAGSVAVNRWVRPQIDKLQQKLRTATEGHEGIASFGRRARYNLTNIPEILNTYANDPSREGQYSFLGTLAEMLQSVLPQYSGDSATLTDTTVEELERAVPWSRRSDLTLNEVLPGWLSKIHGALTGVDEQYDHTKKAFVATKEIEDQIRGRVGDQETREYIREEIDDLVSKIVGDREVSENDRRILGRTLDEKIRKVQLFDARELVDSHDGYGEAGRAEDVSGLMDLFSDISFDKSEIENLNNEVSAELKRIRQQIAPLQDVITEMSDLYGHTAVVNSGVINRKDLTLNDQLTDTRVDVADIKSDDPEVRSRIKNVLIGLGTGDSFNNANDVSIATRDRDGKQRDPVSDIYQGMRDALYTEDPNLRTVLTDVLYGQENEHSLYKVIEDACGKLGGSDRRGGESTLDTLVEKIHAQLVANDVSPQIDAILDIIEHMSRSGIGTYEQPEDSERLGYFGKFGASLRKKKESALGKLKTGYGWAREKAGSVRSWVGEKFGGPVDLLRSIKNTFSDVAGSALDGIRGIRDIYDETGKVVLSGRLLKAGEYFSADGKVIKSIKDIKGAIYDRAGNVVISAEDMLRNGSKFTYYSKRGWRKLSEMVGGIVGGVAGRVLGMPKVIINRLSAPAKNLYHKSLVSNDIYVEGEDEPRIKRYLMLKGFYLDKKTGNPIRSVSDITGPVITSEGNEVVSDSELADPNFRFVDVNGKPFKSLLGRMGQSVFDKASKLKGLTGKGLNLLKSAGGFAADLLGSGMEWLGGKLSLNIGTAEIKDVLTDIYDLLDERMPQAEKRNIHDDDGDGVRDGSFREILRRRREAREEADGKPKEEKETKEKRDPLGWLKNIGSTALTAITGLASSFAGTVIGKLGGGLMDLASKFATWLAAALGGKKIMDALGDRFGRREVPTTAGDIGGDSKDKKRGTKDLKRKRKGPGGRRSSQRVTESVTKQTGNRATKKAAADAAKKAAQKAPGKGRAMKAAARTGKWAARGAAALVGTGTLTSIGTGIATATTAVVGALSAPVVLGSIAVAGTGYLAYKLITKKTNHPIDQIRFVQYGINKYKDGKDDQVKKIRYLESELMRFTSYTDEGVASIRGFVGGEAHRVAEGFGVKIDSEEDLTTFNNWFYGRFSPIYLLWASRIRQISAKSSMLDLEGTMPDTADLKALARQTLLPENHPLFNFTESPFEGGWFGKGSLVSGTEVRKVHLDTIKLINALPESRPVGESGDVKEPSVRVAGQDTPKGDNEELLKTKPDNPSVLDVALGLDETGREDTSEVIIKEGPHLAHRERTEIKATEAARLRAYGLEKLTSSRINVLFNLEQDVRRFIKSSRSGTIFKGDVDEVAKRNMASFGMSPDNEAQLFAWKGWFTNRFLPILVKYLTVLYSYAPNARPFDLTESSSTMYLVDVVKALTHERVNVGGENISVWNVAFNPWSDAPAMNKDPSSIDENIAYLESLKKEKEVVEPKVRRSVRDQSTDHTTRGNNEVRIYGAAGSTVAGGTGGSGMYRAGGSDVFGDSSIVDGSITEGGIPIGDITDPVDPNGAYAKIKLASKSKGDVAKMIRQVAKVTGMDENLLLTVAQMESSLNPDAGATTSSAKGLFQFLVGKDGKSGTWGEQLGIHANRYGIPSNVSVFDPVANALLGAEYLRHGAKTVGHLAPSGKATPVDLYLSHFLGPGGARTFLSGLKKHPGKSILPEWKKQADANKDIFTSGGRPRSYQGMYAELQRRARNAFKGISKYSSNPTVIDEPMPTPESPEVAAVTNSPQFDGGSLAPTDSGLSEPMTPEQRDATTEAKAKQDVNQETARQSQGVASTISPGEAISAGTNIATTTVENTRSNLGDKPNRVDMDHYEETVRDEVMSTTVTPSVDIAGVMSSVTRQQVAMAEVTNGILNRQLEAQQQMAKTLLEIREHLISKGGESTRQQVVPPTPPTRKTGPEIVHQHGIISMARERQ